MGLVAAGLGGLGVPYILAVGLWLLAIASAITVGQRLSVVYRQAVSAAPRPSADRESDDRQAVRAGSLVAAGFASGWAVVPPPARAVSRLGLPRHRRPAVAAPRQVGAPAGVQPRQGDGPIGRRPGDPDAQPRRACAPTSATSTRSFRLPSMTRERIVSGMHVTGDEADLRQPRRRARRGPRAAAHGQLGPGRRLARRRRATRSPPSRSGSSPSRCSTASSPSARGSAWRCCRSRGGDGARLRHPGRSACAQGRTVCLPAERDLTASGVEVDFFGAPHGMPAGPGAARRPHRGRADARPSSGSRATDWGLRVHEEIPVPDEGTRKEKVAAMTQASGAPSSRRASPTTRRTGTCCSGSGWRI